MKNEKPANFLSDEEYSGRDFLERTLLDLDKQEEISSAQLSRILHRYVTRTAGSPNKMGVALIEVEEGDGMTWLAEYLTRGLRSNLKLFRFFCIKGDLEGDRLPAFSGIFTEEEVLRLARKAKFIPAYKRNEWIKTTLISFGAVLAALLFTLTMDIIKKNIPDDFQSLGRLFQDANFYIASGVALVLALAGKFLADNRKLLSKEEAKARLVERLGQRAETMSDRYGRFIALLSDGLGRLGYPRLMVIDHYEGLSAAEQAAIQHYFRKKSEGLSVGADVWMVFVGKEALEEKTRFWELKKPLNLRSFVLSPLTNNQKEILARQRDLPKEYMEFRTIREICQGQLNEASEKKFKEAVDAFKKKDPPGKNRYGDLEFLYLLSQNSKPYNMKLSGSYLIDSFSTKNVRNAVLRKILFNAALTRTEISSRMEGVFKHFQELLEVQEPGKETLHKMIRLKPGVYEAFDKNKGEFGLIDSRLCHFFWSLFWGDKLLNHPIQYTWTRKLSFHLLEVGDSFYALEDDNEFKTLTDNLFNYFLLSLTFSVKACYFQDIEKLLEKASYLLGDFFNYDPVKSVTLVKKSWQVYSILFKDEILSIIIDNFNRSPGLEPGSVEKENILDKVFFESINHAGIRDNPHRVMLFYPHSAHEDTFSIRNYFRTLSAWMCISMHPLTGQFEKLELREAAVYSRDYLRNTSKAIARIRDSQKEENMEFDLRILSLSLWSKALTLVPQYRPDFGFDILEEYSEFLDLIQSAVDTAVQVKALKMQHVRNLYSVDYLINGLVSEIVTVSVSSMIAPLFTLLEWAKMPLIIEGRVLPNPIPGFLNEQYEKICRILDAINREFNARLPIPRSEKGLAGEEMFRTVDQMFQWNSVVWNQLGVDSLEEALAIRRFQFKSLWHDYSREAYNPETDVEDLPLHQPNFLGIMANIARINSHENLHIKSYFLNRLVSVIIENGYGPLLSNELGILLITRFNMTHQSIDNILETVLDSRWNSFRNYQAGLDDDDFYRLFVSCQNQRKKIQSPALLAGLDAALDERIGRLTATGVRMDVEDWRKLDQMKNRVSSQETLDPEATLAEWEERKRSWLYPAVLNLLITNGHKTPAIKTEALATFSDFSSDTGNTRFNLAQNMLYWLTPEEKKRENSPLNYLRTNMNVFRADQEISSVIYCYEELLQNRGNLQLSDQEVKDFSFHLEKLKKDKFLDDHLELLPRLRNDGQYFIILEKYYNDLHTSGFHSDISYNEYLSERSKSQGEKQAFIRPFLEGAELPPLFSGQEGFMALNSRFLVLGSLVFTMNSRGNEKMTRLREQINQQVRRHFPTVLSLIRRLPLKSDFLEILDNFYKRHEHLDVPEN